MEYIMIYFLDAASSLMGCIISFRRYSCTSDSCRAYYCAQVIRVYYWPNAIDVSTAVDVLTRRTFWTWPAAL